MLYLKAIPWQIPNFTIETFEPQLRSIDQKIQHTGPFITKAHRFLVIARKD